MCFFVWIVTLCCSGGGGCFLSYPRFNLWSLRETLFSEHFGCWLAEELSGISCYKPAMAGLLPAAKCCSGSLLGSNYNNSQASALESSRSSSLVTSSKRRRTRRDSRRLLLVSSSLQSMVSDMSKKGKENDQCAVCTVGNSKLEIFVCEALQSGARTAKTQLLGFCKKE